MGVNDKQYIRAAVGNFNTFQSTLNCLRMSYLRSSLAAFHAFSQQRIVLSLLLATFFLPQLARNIFGIHQPTQQTVIQSHSTVFAAPLAPNAWHTFVTKSVVSAAGGAACAELNLPTGRSIQPLVVWANVQWSTISWLIFVCSLIIRSIFLVIVEVLRVLMNTQKCALLIHRCF